MFLKGSIQICLIMTINVFEDKLANMCLVYLLVRVMLFILNLLYWKIDINTIQLLTINLKAI